MWHMECLAASRSCSIHKLIFEVRAYYISLKAICVARSSLISYSLPFLNWIKEPDICYPHNLDGEAKFQYSRDNTFFRRLFTGLSATNPNKLLWIPPEPNCLNPNTYMCTGKLQHDHPGSGSGGQRRSARSRVSRARGAVPEPIPQTGDAAHPRTGAMLHMMSTLRGGGLQKQNSS